MGNIVLLDDLTINQIAAGEVIERPASVVKELVENSIDAGATNITVEIKNGGISYIRITDNGKGIMADDMEIAFERHATSKIRQADDLKSVKSMGFRGEALASIASIARVEMISKHEDSDVGYKIVIEGGDILEKEEWPSIKGTTITIENLFYNTPVRYKFLKKDFTEAGYIEDAVTRIALVNPNIAIKLISSGKTVIQTPGTGDMKSVIYSIYGKDIAENILDVDYTYEDITLKGVVGKPVIARSNRSNQIFFVNKRYVKDKTLSSATEQGFKGLLTIGKFGFVILNLDMSPELVDVNVHPAKLEVRFQEESKVFKAVYHAIKDTLLKTDIVSNPDNAHIKQENKVEIQADNVVKQEEVHEEKKSGFFSGLFGNRANVEVEDQRIENNKNMLQEIFRDRNHKKAVEREENNISNDPKINNDQVVENIEKPVVENKISEEEKVQENATQIQESHEENKSFDEMYAELFGKAPVEKKEPQENQFNTIDMKKVENVSVFEDDEKYAPIKYKFIGIVFSTYIILEMDNEMYILDQHAAHERILYEQVKKNYYSEGVKDSQLMLLPDIITLTHKEMDVARENLDMFRKVGFMLEEFGENTIKLTGVPNICIDLNTKELFLETLDEINTVARTAKQEKEERFIATVACKAAVKANMSLSREEVDSLMSKLLKLPNPFTCPHGRPTAIKMSKTDIEKKFSRRL